MDISIPTALKTFAAGGAAMKSITSWWRKSKGDTRAVIGEMKDNLSYLDMVAEDGVPLADVVEKLALVEYKRLANEGFNFNTLKKSKIAKLPSLKGTDLENWTGKETEELVHSINEKINQIKIRFPHVSTHKKYRWGIRVMNIRKRIWLLLKHINS
ncbi:hypothetical protein QX776_00175 [Alteromonadaceae bacterium BrNp21-10]|nr:hypothetical protein [Alteromonadaceae bacterium BrNp21-10]